MPCDLSHNPRRPITDAEWLRASATKQSDPRARDRFLAVARRLDLLLFRNLELEESVMDIAAIATAAQTKVSTLTKERDDAKAAAPSPAAVDALKALATAVGVDENGVPLPVVQ